MNRPDPLLERMLLWVLASIVSVVILLAFVLSMSGS